MNEAAAIRHELGCDTRTFLTVKGAMLWYRDQMASMLRVTRAPDADQVRLSREGVERNRATRARIRACCEPNHPADAQITSLGLRRLLPLDGELLVFLVAWYEGDWGDGSDLAKRAELTRWSFDRRCRRTENILRERLRESGLLREETT